jgi:hypothetical protein
VYALSLHPGHCTVYPAPCPFVELYLGCILHAQCCVKHGQVKLQERYSILRWRHHVRHPRYAGLVREVAGQPQTTPLITSCTHSFLVVDTFLVSSFNPFCTGELLIGVPGKTACVSRAVGRNTRGLLPFPLRLPLSSADKMPW